MSASRLMPPKVGSSEAMVSISLSGSRSSISRSKDVDIGELLNSTPLPSITGQAASGPIGPRPKIGGAVGDDTDQAWRARSVPASRSATISQA